MWGAKKVESVSNFFEGINFIKKCFDDFFEIFTNAINKTNLEVKELTVPKVIVIGSESSGKSSLLENIVKCQLFPKNTTFCTKIPIHLVMKNTTSNAEIKYKLFYDNNEINTTKENIYKEIEKIMNTIIDDISDDKIIRIEIVEKNIVDFEFYDLPGIRAYPPDLATKTTNLAKKYLSMEDVIPICVIPATTPRITSYIPMALIKEYKKEKDTFICLTMCDRLQDENIEDLLINRIILKTDEYDSNTFGGICGIINRTHKNNIRLFENDNVEKDWFQSNIYAAMPSDYIHKTQLLENLGINNLINKLSSAYKKYVSEKWLPNIVKKIINENNNLREELKNIGFDPKNKEDKDKFIEALIHWFRTNMKKYIVKVYDEIEDYRKQDEYGNTDFLSVNELTSWLDDNGATLDGKYYFSYPFYECIERINKYNILCYVGKYKNQEYEPQKNNTLIELSDSDEEDEEDDESDNEYDNKHTLIINIERFDDLINEIIHFNNIQMKKFNEDFMSKYKLLIEYDSLTLNVTEFEKKISNLSKKYIDKLVDYINEKISYDKMYELFEKLKNLEEDEETSTARIELNEKIKKNNEALGDLEKIVIK